MLSAGVAELVDALDLGSSDESRGGSSPSARTKAPAFAPDNFRRTNFRGLAPLKERSAEPPTQAFQGQASNRLTMSGLGRTKREED